MPAARTPASNTAASTLASELADLLHDRSAAGAARRHQALDALIVALDGPGGPALPGRRVLLALQDALCFLLAYPQSAAERRLAERAADTLAARCRALSPAARARLDDSGLAASEMHYAYSYGVVQKLLARGAPLEIDWDAVDDDAPLIDLLTLLVAPGESIGLEDISMPLSQWLEACRPRATPSDLAFVVELLEGSRLPTPFRAHLFERCELPLRLALSAADSPRLQARARPARERDASAPRSPVPLAMSSRG